MHKTLAFGISIALLTSAAASDAKKPDKRFFEPKNANPSAILAEEIAFNRMAQEKGQWTAFRQYAAKEATMFVPQPVDAQTWLKGRADPSTAVKWQPHASYMSCDGKTGVTTGAWQKNGTSGYFTTVWQWFDKGQGKGEWKFVMDHGDALKAPREAPEFLVAKVASCKGRAPATLSAPGEGDKMKVGLSRDQSLSWTWIVKPDGSRTVEVKLWNGTGSDTVILDRVAASAG